MIESLDGYTSDAAGNLDWPSQTKGVHSFINDADRAGLRPRSGPTVEGSVGHDLTVGGPGLAAQAIKAALVDEYHLFVVPVLVGGGTPTFPHDVRLDLELLDERRFAGGVVHLHYRAAAP